MADIRYRLGLDLLKKLARDHLRDVHGVDADLDDVIVAFRGGDIEIARFWCAKEGSPDHEFTISAYVEDTNLWMRTGRHS